MKTAVGCLPASNRLKFIPAAKSRAARAAIRIAACQVEFILRSLGELNRHFLGVVSLAVKAAVDDRLHSLAQRCKQGGNQQGGDDDDNRRAPWGLS